MRRAERPTATRATIRLVRTTGTAMGSKAGRPMAHQTVHHTPLPTARNTAATLAGTMAGAAIVAVGAEMVVGVVGAGATAGNPATYPFTQCPATN